MNQLTVGDYALIACWIVLSAFSLHALATMPIRYTVDGVEHVFQLGAKK